MTSPREEYLSDTKQGEKLLNAVERIVDGPEKLIAFVREIEATTTVVGDQEVVRQAVAQTIIGRFSNNSAISGGVAALPGIVPGLGTLTAVTGGALMDMGFVLKFEVEMAMCLTHLYGFDIHDERERQFALLLASVGTYEAKTGRNYFVDLAAAQGTAIWNYTPRQMSKALISVMTKLALLSMSKSLVRAIPLVGVVVGSGVNKLLTARVGKGCQVELSRRRGLVDAELAEADVAQERVRFA